MIIRIFIILNLFHLTIPQQTISSQCPCVLKPGTNVCLQYDTTFQATSINEAVQNFQDLTLSDENNKTGYASIETSAQSSTSCQELLLSRLAQVGLVSNNTKINQFINATADLTCNKYRFSKPDPSVYEYGHKHDDDGDDDDTSSDDDSDDDVNSGDIKDELKNQIDQMKKYKKKGDKRRRRQASNSNNNSVIGTRYNLSCTAKGIDDGSGYIKLCSACWAWRQLPSNYFPQYVNELICDDTDGECLSGYATCSVGTRTFEVIRNDSGVASVVTLTAGSYCECKVLSGSALTSLVTGSSGTLPPLNQFVSSTKAATRNPPLFGK
uniref:Uncharacterized protein n=1 Tax=Acrobeloides nanus TaxID=290746 RepID=A0A914C5B6_9BILA